MSDCERGCYSKLIVGPVVGSMSLHPHPRLPTISSHLHTPLEAAPHSLRGTVVAATMSITLTMTIVTANATCQEFAAVFILFCVIVISSL